MALKEALQRGGLASLTHLDVSEIRWGGSGGGQVLADALRLCADRLRWLSLAKIESERSEKEKGPDPVQRLGPLASALQASRTLQCINLGGFHASMADMIALAAALQVRGRREGVGDGVCVCVGFGVGCWCGWVGRVVLLCVCGGGRGKMGGRLQEGRRRVRVVDTRTRTMAMMMVRLTPR